MARHKGGLSMFRRLVIFCISFTASVTVICTDGTPPLSFAARAANLPLAYDSVGIRFLKKPIPVASQLIFSLDDQLWTIDLAAYGFDGIDPTTIDRAQLRQKIIDTVKQSERKPRDAYFQGEQIVPHLNGRRVDQRQIAYILDHLISLQNRIVPMPVTETEAKITAKTLERLSEKVLGSYTTIYNPYNRPRARNIGLSSTAIDSVIIPVGGIFSFNDIVGPRTPDRGYKRATVIVQGEYAEDYGGGICQTSSTLFNSIDQSGLKIVERAVHTKIVTYVPRGRDATVSWGGPDFKFQNNTNRPILIRSFAYGGYLTIKIYSQADVQFQQRSVPKSPQEKLPSEQIINFS